MGFRLRGAVSRGCTGWRADLGMGWCHRYSLNIGGGGSGNFYFILPVMFCSTLGVWAIQPLISDPPRQCQAWVPSHGMDLKLDQ